MTYADNDAIERREDYGFGDSLSKQGRVPCAGMSKPDTSAEGVWSYETGCYWTSGCQADRIWVKRCRGGLATCWDHQRAEPEGETHADIVCSEGHVRTTQKLGK